MTLASILASLLPISLALIVASVGLRAERSDLVAARGRPALVVRAVVAVNLVVPAVAVAALWLLPVEPVVKLGVLAMAIAPIAPLLPGRMIQAGAGTPVAVGLYCALLLLAIPIVPATVALIALMFGSDAAVPVGAVARLAIVTGLVPLAAGLVLAGLAPRRARQLATFCNLAGMLILLPFFVLILIRFGGGLWALVGDGVLFAILLAVGAGLAAGHALGGPRPEERRALALAAAIRHPGIAVLIVHANSDDPRATLAALLFLFASLVASFAYQAWALRRPAPESPARPAERAT